MSMRLGRRRRRVWSRTLTRRVPGGSAVSRLHFVMHAALCLLLQQGSSAPAQMSLPRRSMRPQRPWRCGFSVTLRPAVSGLRTLVFII